LTLLSGFARSPFELGVYTFEASMSGVEVQAGPGGGGGDVTGKGDGGGGEGDNDGGGDEATDGGGGGRSTHRTADASFVVHRSPLVAWFAHRRNWPFHSPKSARWP